MKHWTHDELHELIDGDPALKKRSDKAHAFPSDYLDGLAKGKRQMLNIYVEVAGCKRLHQAKDYLEAIIQHIEFITWEEYKSKGLGNKLTELQDKYKAEKKCHSPAGNDYVCHCK